MNRDQIRNWLKQEMQPIDLATPDPVVTQQIESALRYFNNNSAFRIVRMYPISYSLVPQLSGPTPTLTPPNQMSSQGQKRLVVSPEFKMVAEVFPATGNAFIFNSHPLWSLLGTTIIDNITSDLIILGESYRNYRYYIGNDFRFHFEQNENPELGGSLYLSNTPYGAARVCVVGSKRYSSVFTSAVLVGNQIQASWIPVSGDKINVYVDNVLYPNINTYQTSFTDVCTAINTAVGKTVATVNGSGFIQLTSTTQGLTSNVAVQDGTNGTVGSMAKLFDATLYYAQGTGDYDIKNEWCLDWVLQYSRALLKITEGRLLRKGDIISVKNDGQELVNEGEKEKEKCEKKLSVDGRWLALIRKG